ncbi:MULTISPECIES: AraC family transcriptional regulator [unclassified Cryobacterium]|uniref:AraC family transcriptional regulator n=1 Tax=unclassified Cryobacterium TaxID=2649013 RepID=UPI002AB494AD|nr:MULTISPECIES: AraC family transcriptional regulator ligand-binding domain-containing protein [unclassified Cryobacterium]MDY7543741.1 AraC family transcriptional regulator ligand-binding domain-containing protein [Cryobacterium sp. 5B3]MEA9997547.1 AraC family transcriptional regulator ligand-binding domain-containing protein [Cryobacterium sp. RTS3]MEB0264288.1 AraC family transcriptional regulator ligand-binding domain-containing protein [Cryobacterium sp. 10I5]MEB0273470.1 AraC family tra
MNDAENYRVNPGLKLLLSDAGINPDDVLRRAMLPHDLFAGEKAWLTPEEFFRLWGAMEDEADDPLLPIRIGQSISVETFDPLAFAALCSRDLNSAAHRVAGYKRIVGPMRLVVETTPAETSMELQWPDSTVAPPSLAMVDLVFIVALARIATRSSIRPLRVSSLVPPEHTDEYADFLGVAVSQGISCKVIFSAADAARPFLTVNESMWQTFEPQLRLRLAELQPGASSAERVRSALVELLPTGDGSMMGVARELSLSTRSMQRKLKAEGTSFQEILHRTREALARHYLSQAAMTTDEIAFLLGFNDPRSFYRAFQSWTGLTPRSAELEAV